MAKIGIIGARFDRSGLSNQTEALVHLLRPDRILAIDSSGFNKGRLQDYGKYEGFEVYTISHFPTNLDCARFIKGLTHIFAAETWYNDAILGLARMKGIKTYLQPNIEFSDIFAKSQGVNNGAHIGLHPTTYLLPSHWMEEEWKAKFPNSQYLPPPIFPGNFKNARQTNFERSGRRRFLHVVGRFASKDRNGTLSLLEALKHAKEDFELVIRSQDEIPEITAATDDRRITWDIRNLENAEDLYKDADCLLLPRRYGGLCLPMIEGLISGLPVIMTDISPNNAVLPQGWLVDSPVTDTLKTRIMLDVYSADPQKLAEKMDWLATMPDKELQTMKLEAFELGYEEYSDTVLRPKYEELLR